MEQQPNNNWWDSWLSSAKTKSAEVYSMVKKDLDEIGTAVKSEASHVFSTTSNAIGKTLKLDEPESPANVMKKSISTFIDQVSTALNPEPDDEDDTEVILSTGDTTMLSTYKKELEALQRVDATFIVPTDSPEFESWRKSIENVEEGVISARTAFRRLDSYPILKAQYEKLVPDAVSHHEFWERYLFRVALLQDKLANAARRSPPDTAVTQDPVLAHLPVHTDISPNENLQSKDNISGKTPDNDLTWKNDDFGKEVELTEEQQTLLLEEYEKEISTKKITKPAETRDITSNIKCETTSKNALQSSKTKSPPARGNGKSSENKKQNSVLPKKVGKIDMCENGMVEDHFGDCKENVKDDLSAHSDESWEKIEDGNTQKS